MDKKIKNVTYACNDNDLLTPYVGSEIACFCVWNGHLNWHSFCFDWCGMAI